MVKCAVHVTQGGTEGTVLRKGYGKKIANLLPNGFRQRYIFTSADSKSGSCEFTALESKSKREEKADVKK